MATFADLENWVYEDLGRFASWQNNVHRFVKGEAAEGRVKNKFYLYTKTNRYQIVAIEDDKGGYLGCQAGTRKPRAGEDWTRGTDLPDGKFTRETWKKILFDIVSYELVKIHNDE